MSSPISDRARIGIKLSGIFLAVVNESYYTDLLNGEAFVLSQYNEMKKYPERPLILLWHDIGDEQKARIRKMFQMFKTVREMGFSEFMENGKPLLEELSREGLRSG